MSEQNNKKQMAVGAFIFTGLAILVIGIFTIGGQRKAFVKTFRLEAVFEDAQGLQAGNNVWLSGIKVGTVKKVAFDAGSGIEVTLNVEKEARSHIHKDATARVTTDGLVGNKILVIDGGTPTAPLIAEGDSLRGQHQGSTSEMMATLQASNANLLEITGNLKTISKKLAAGEGTLGQLINDPSLGNGLKASIGSLQAASEGSEKIIRNLQHYTADLRRPGTLADQLVTDTTVFFNLKATVAKLNEAANTASAFALQMQRTGEGIDKSLSDPGKPIGLLLNDQETADNLQRTIKNLRVSSKELADDLEAVQHSWLLRGFFKKRDK
ncbi:MlaD family protein [Flavitalea sp. BT771]|uniref:MlaD family protein n=1 Tax=Flavitalea sp. BT771 TaxID=3063329 RepID=UPI0026E277B9|nr:MlaD family protein [Flavitalea sp. BT771]MDO6434549.1 MlaD family protein [Flavitalea sp. BT771]MDV6223449.1 MlaD family protein [Flavitalea sp. BT771]